ncbi:MarR family winged helix-turn-helix transcriptional regulator [Curvibacter sp. PAE-UM]|uniref:MarR family winged helix-turn-helix transcriptional regulator n=1 Tax=Curvibacter sp. PAE-UM TaxID=1714344 RepID=UPI00070E2D8E|nr:MarR family transcriptional regulator [Curvibacter sp. PAE-UM]KRI01284.1 MarR family transcriptional regulator [Curvibacter sp. PAE-UM]
MATRKPSPDTAIEQVDTSYLESLVGYNARRATLVIVDAFLRNMAVYGLRPVDFSVLSLIAHNPGITSRQLCTTLNIQPPNLVGMINQLQRRELITRRPHPHDGRAMGLHLTAAGKKMVKQAEVTASELEEATTARLTVAERKMLMQLLRKIYI